MAVQCSVMTPPTDSQAGSGKQIAQREHVNAQAPIAKNVTRAKSADIAESAESASSSSGAPGASQGVVARAELNSRFERDALPYLDAL